MFGFGKKAAAVRQDMKKIEKRDFMQALCAGAVLVAFADGELEDAEVKALHDVIESQESLKAFGSEIGQTIDRFIGVMKAGKTLGKMQLMKEIDDVKGDESEKLQVFALMVDIAGSDGEIEAAEIKVLTDVARKLGVNVKDFDLPAAA